MKIRGSRPVSYTHLDVYKRQGYDNAVKAVELIVSDQISEAMNEYNRKKKDE